MFSKKFPGSDDLASYFIKIASTAIAPFLTHLIDFMFSQGIFSDLLKIAKVVPIFKSSDKTLTENYRPISLLSSFSKVIEKLIKTRTGIMYYMIDREGLEKIIVLCYLSLI